MRLETIRKKRNAVQKFMNGDIVELLRNGLYYNAYRRAEGLLLEQNMSSCYELIANFIGCISDHLEDLYKKRDCPDECKEAIPSLMYAAARVADLPELRDLRTLFTEKFGNSLDPYISKEFVEKLRRDPPTKEMKIRLLYDTAQEFSLELDGKAFEQRLYTPPPLHNERPKLEPLSGSVDEEWHENNDVAIPKTKQGGKSRDEREYKKSKSKGNERDTLPERMKNIIINDEHSWRHQSTSSDDDTSTDMSSHDGRKTSSSSSSLGSVSEDELVEIKRLLPYWQVPPPYPKQKTNKGEINLDKTTDSHAVLPEQESEQLQAEYDSGQNRRSTRSYVRGTSLPPHPTSLVETSKGHTRANSLGAGHVHPNLPDYDDLASRLAALRRR